MAEHSAKVYTVNGATAGSSSSLPDWLVRKRAAAKRTGKRTVREHVEGTIELIQGFEFPEASNRVKTTRDGHHVIATGTYKPQIRVWDLDQLSLKFERHSDAENVDFVILSDDWTKSIHLQNDRTIELHTQGGFHHRMRIPRFGRSLAYHFGTCDAYFSASGNEIYRLNLEQGRFMTPFVLEDGGDGDILGVNVIDINAAHQLLAFGVDGNGTLQFWDPRSRAAVGTLRLPAQRLLPAGSGTHGAPTGFSVTAIASRSDGLSYAVGTSTGHTLLYDIRSTRAFALKDQGYGLPIKNVTWLEGGSRMAGDGMLLSADKKVIKIWDRSMPSSNFASITPANDLNDIHHVPGSGLLLTANEGIPMSAFYIPQMGPAPRWASFLENITEEMEDQTTHSIYEDYKFVERAELKTLGLDHLVGTPALKPYMHGYFIALKLYDTARVIANPFAYAEHREKMVRDKMDRMAEARIRTRKDIGVKVNKVLAEKIAREEEKAKKRNDRRSKRATEEDAVAHGEREAEDTSAVAEQPSILNDPRFSKVFQDPEFEIDENSREYALLNPSAAFKAKGKTAVEEEAEESGKSSSDGLGESGSTEGSDGESHSDTSDEGELTAYDPRARPGQKNRRTQEAYDRTRERNRVANVQLAPMRAQRSGDSAPGVDKNATFGQRRQPLSSQSKTKHTSESFDDSHQGLQISWVPSTSKGQDGEASEGHGKPRSQKKRNGAELFGVGMERGGQDLGEISESEKKGRTQRRKGIRSGSKNAFRKMDK